MLAAPTEAALSTELAEAVDRARDSAKASKTHATRKAYAADLRDFAAYCQRIGALSLPADPAVVGTYLADDRRNEVGRDDPPAHGRDRAGA